MTEREMIGKVHSSVYHQCQRRGYATAVDMLMDIGVLGKRQYEDWRFGRIPFLEAVCTVNLRKLSFAMKQMRIYAIKSGYKPSVCFYKRWGMKNAKHAIPLRFSKSGDPAVERGYSTHYVDLERIKQLRKEQEKTCQNPVPECPCSQDDPIQISVGEHNPLLYTDNAPQFHGC